MFVYLYALSEFIACRVVVGKSLGIRFQVESREGKYIALRSILGKELKTVGVEWTWLKIVYNG
jgi:hypothetical protein